MRELRSGDQVIEFDRDATACAYATIERGDSERCGCSYCRNFMSQRSVVYPKEFLALLEELGIDSSKEDEVYECGPAGSLRWYRGWFFFSGELIQPGERATSELHESFSFYFADAARRPRPKAEFGQKVLALEFTTKVEWILEEEP